MNNHLPTGLVRLRAPEGFSSMNLHGRQVEADASGHIIVLPHEIETAKSHGFRDATVSGYSAPTYSRPITENSTTRELIAAAVDKVAGVLATYSDADLLKVINSSISIVSENALEEPELPDMSEDKVAAEATVPQEEETLPESSGQDFSHITTNDIKQMSRKELSAFLKAHNAEPINKTAESLRVRAMKFAAMYEAKRAQETVQATQTEFPFGSESKE